MKYDLLIGYDLITKFKIEIPFTDFEFDKQKSDMFSEIIKNNQNPDINELIEKSKSEKNNEHVILYEESKQYLDKLQNTFEKNKQKVGLKKQI